MLIRLPVNITQILVSKASQKKKVVCMQNPLPNQHSVTVNAHQVQVATLGGYLKCTTASRILRAIHRTFFRKNMQPRIASNTAFITQHKVQNPINTVIKVSNAGMQAKMVSRDETDGGVRV